MSEDAKALCRDKAHTKDLLTTAGLPVAPGMAFSSAQRAEARRYALTLDWPVVVKPLAGIKGLDITSNIRSEADLDRALRVASSSQYATAGFLVEKHVPGDDHRMLATRSQTLSVIRRDPASVRGDGISTVQELAELRNQVRLLNPYLGRTPNLIRLDDASIHLLRSQGFTINSVPPHGVRVTLSPTANLSRGGDSTEVTADTHQSLTELAAAAVAAVPGLPLGGVDIMLEDRRRAATNQAVHIIEINHNPALMMHPYPMYGEPSNVFRDIVQDAARAAGMSILDPIDTITVRIMVLGKVQGVYFRKWARRQARRLSLDGWVANSPQRDRLAIVTRGQAERIGMFIHRCLRGPDGAVVHEVHSYRDDWASIEPGFHVLKYDP